MEKWPIGVFVSVDAGLGVHMDVVRELGIPTVQVHAPHKGNRTELTAERFLAETAAAGVTVTAVFGGFEDESYADIATTARTVGLVPQATRADRLEQMKEIAAFARYLGCKVVGLHIGFVPESSTEDYENLLSVTRELLDELAAHGQSLHLETGQEPADHLLQFIGDVGRSNLFINFDPANMVLYGMGDPIEALKKVGHLVRSVHCKDAKAAAPDVRGKEWGREVALGDGDVGMEAYLRTLKEIGYEGPLTIEREIPEDRAQQKADIGQAVNLLNDLKAKIG